LSSNLERSLFAGIFCLVELHSNAQDRVRGGLTLDQRSCKSRRLCSLLMFIIFISCITQLRVCSSLAGQNPMESEKEEGQIASPESTGPIITDTTIPQALGTATLFVPWFMSFANSVFNSNWNRTSGDRDLLSLSVSPQLYYGVAPRTEVYLVVPYLHNWTWGLRQPPQGGPTHADFGGLGNVSITGKYLLTEEHPNYPAISGIFTATFPTGHHRHLDADKLGTDFLGRGSYTFTPGLNFFKYLKPFLLYGNIWYTFYTPATVNGEEKYYSDRVTLNLAAEYPIVLDRLVFLFEFVSFYDVGRLLGHRENQYSEVQMSILPAVEVLATENWSVDIGVLIDLFGKNSTAGYSPNLSIFYSF